MNSPAPSYHGDRFPSEIMAHVVWLYMRCSLSVRDVEDWLAQRGIIATYESNRQWCRTFGRAYARRLRHRWGRLGDIWPLDELCVAIAGRRQDRWRAVEADGAELDILVQSRRHRRATIRFFRKLLKKQGGLPRRLITDQRRRYPAAPQTVMHSTQPSANNRAAVSHQPTWQRERQMRRFQAAAHLQRFAATPSVVQNLFRVARHWLQAVHHRLFRTRAFAE